MPSKTSTPSVSRDFILLFVVIMVIITLVSVWVAFKTFENYAEGVVSEMEGEATRIDRSMIVEIKSASYLLESLARQIVQIGAGKPEKISRLLRSFDDNNNSRNDEFLWLDKNQDAIITSTSGILSKPTNVSDRDYVKKALTAPWHVHMGRPMKGRVTERWVLPLSLGVTDYKNQFVGILILSIDIEALTKELAEVIQQSGMNFSVFTPTLTLITDSQEIGDGDIYDKANVTPLSAVKFDKKPKGMISSPTLFKPLLPFVYYELSSQYPYVIYLTYDQVKNDDKIFSLLQARLVQILIIAVFLLSLLWMVRTRIIRPVEKLSEITAGISAGKAYQPLPKGGPIEIENLGNQIRKLSEYITEQQRIEEEMSLKNQFLGKMKETTQMFTRVRSEFLLGLTKDLETQLKAILPHMHAVRDQRYGEIPREYIEEIQSATAKIAYLRQVVEDVRTISEAEYGTFSLRESSVNISFAIHRAVRQFHQYPHYRHVEVKLKVSEQLPILIIDEEKFTQILVNLLCGASTTLAQGAAITVSAQVEYNAVGNDELVIHMKYSSQHQPAISQDHGRQESSKIIDKQEKDPLIKTDMMCFALSRMLISLYDGELTITTSKNEMNHLSVRFLKNRLMIKG
jgi:HAMP domain-containing protein